VSTVSGDVAIIGMACVFPGAANLASCGRNIVAKVDAVSDPPQDWLIPATRDYEPVADSEEIYTRRGGYIGDLARFTEFALAPQRAMLSLPWRAPITRLTDNARCCRILQDETGEGAWLRILASLILNRREQATWSRMEAPKTRRRDWLLGRLVAKDAVRLLLKDQHHIQLAAADIDIEADEHGRPRVAEPLQRALGLEVVISLSHTGGDAVAVAAESGGRLGIGVDLEHLRDLHRGFADAAFGQQECALLEKLPSAEPSEWLLRLWCAKEAAGKALGTGLGGSPRNFVAHKVDPVGGTVWLRAPTKPAGGRKMEIVAQTGCEDGLVFAASMV
jgi:phosphopantetheinyl transferase